MLDVSEAIDNLFGGVIPERVEEVKALWGREGGRVRLTDQVGHVLGVIGGRVLVSEIALRQFWIAAFATMQAMNAYASLLPYLGGVFDPAMLARLEGQVKADRIVDEALAAIAKLSKALEVDDVALPSGIPYPRLGCRDENVENAVGFDLACIAGAYAFLHEVRHATVGRDALPGIEDERECDRFARSFVLDQATDWAIENRQDPTQVLAKRVMGVLVAKLGILALTPSSEWSGSQTHPAVADRLREVLAAAPDPAPPWFWPGIAAAIASFVRVLGLRAGVPLGIVIFEDPRDLALKLADGLEAAPSLKPASS